MRVSLIYIICDLYTNYRKIDNKKSDSIYKRISEILIRVSKRTKEANLFLKKRLYQLSLSRLNSLINYTYLIYIIILKDYL